MNNNQTQGVPADGQSQRSEDSGLPGKPIAKGFSLRRGIRIALITLASLMLLLVMAVSILIWALFTPSRLSPIVQKQAEEILPYPTFIESVELTFFSTFPNFGIRIEGFSMVNPFEGAYSDTLASARSLTCVIDARALWLDNELIVRKLFVENAGIHLFIDSLGQTNYGLLLATEPSGADKSGELSFGFVHLHDIRFQGLNMSYVDQSMDLRAGIMGLAGQIHGTLTGDVFSGNIQLRSEDVCFGYAEDQYLEHATVALSIPIEANLAGLHMKINSGGFFSVHGMGLDMTGTMEFDPAMQGIQTDLAFQGENWKLEEFLTLIPPHYMSFLGEFEAVGVFSPKGKINGMINAEVLPVAMIHLSLEDGSLLHEWIPFPLSQARGEMDLFLDMTWETPTVLAVEHFEAQSPLSRYETKGRLHDLIGDMRITLVTDADVGIEEFMPWIPSDIAVDVRGRANGRFHTDFKLSQIMNLELEKLRIDGSALLTGLAITYDSIYLASDRANLVLALPNRDFSNSRRGFAGIKIRADSLFTMAGDSISASFVFADVSIDMSDVRDTTAIPDIQCVFYVDGIQAAMGQSGLSVRQPRGRFIMAPRQAAKHLPLVHLDFTGASFHAFYDGEALAIEDVRVMTDVIYDDSQDDMFLQWMASGHLAIQNGVINTSYVPYPLEIPAVRMDFEPETFTIQESRMKIGHSDFELSGLVKNVLSYFRGDSLLRGNFVFASDHTDLAQLMSLTSGIGTDEEASSDADNSEDSFSGPYMVPKGLDLSLEARVKQATYGPDTISNIRGEVRVKDGILVFDGIDFTTPAADMRLTAMYRTPRKNHLYLGIDYHMFDIDISRLLQMIPDIDTLMPMLRSFQGNGEFHMAIETYLDSLYNIKKSTLRGASSIRGKDLVLLDGETFSEIAKTLRFSRRAENRVDSLAAEFTIFREEIDIYPFLIVMDRYHAVVAGRHNFDMSFNYHISLVDSPLPVRLGIDVSGTLDKMNYRLASPRYAELYRPASRRVVESRQLEFRRMIREALMQNIPQE